MILQFGYGKAFCPDVASRTAFPNAVGGVLT